MASGPAVQHATTLVAARSAMTGCSFARRDSRCYRIRHGHAEALTRDHTVVNEHMRLGLITAAKPPAPKRATAEPVAGPP